MADDDLLGLTEEDWQSMLVPPYTNLLPCCGMIETLRNHVFLIHSIGILGPYSTQAFLEDFDIASAHHRDRFRYSLPLTHLINNLKSWIAQHDYTCWD